MSRCSHCDTIVGRKNSVFCNGLCKNLFHADCVNVPGEVVTYLTSVSGLQWKCYGCRNLDNNFEIKKLQDSLVKLQSDIHNEFTSQLDETKQLILAAYDKSHKATAPDHFPTYAEVARPVQRIIVKPKNLEQVTSHTKADIMQLVNPAKLDVEINNVKRIRNGGIMLSSTQPESILKIKEVAEKNLAANYDVHVLKNINPQIRIVGLSGRLDDDSLKYYLAKQSPDIFPADSDYKICKIWPTKKNENVFQVLLQVNVSTYNKILTRGRILIGLDSCKVYEALHIPRCFNCNSLSHTQKYCANNISCPICAGNHHVKNCPDNSAYHCINCINLKNISKQDISTDHAAWNYEKCSAYKKAAEKFKADLSGQPGI